MNEFLQAVKDRPYFYLSLLCFVVGIAEMGRCLELTTLERICLVLWVGVAVFLAVFRWGRPRGSGGKP